MRSFIAAAVLVTTTAIALPLPASAQASLLDDVARAMGGKERVLAVRTLTLTGTGDNFNFGQSLAPEPPLRASRSAVPSRDRLRQSPLALEQTRAPRFVTGTRRRSARIAAWMRRAYDVLRQHSPAVACPGRHDRGNEFDSSRSVPARGICRRQRSQPGEPVNGAPVRLRVGRGVRHAHRPAPNLPARTRRVIYNP